MPALSTLGIGSLPFGRFNSGSLDVAVEAAIHYAFTLDVPTLPQLPGNTRKGFDHDMLDELDNPRRLVCADPFKRKVLERRPKAVKIQSVGPITAKIYRPYSRKDAILRVRDHLEGLADCLTGIETLYVVLDEPALSNNTVVEVGIPLAWQEIFKDLTLPHGVNIIYGVHLCNSLGDNGVQLLRYAGFVGMKFFSLDATTSNLEFLHRRGDVYTDFRERGGKICWGVVTKVEGGLCGVQSAKEFNPKDLVVSGDFLSSSCGMAGYTPEECRSAYQHLAKLKEEFAVIR